MTPFTPRDDSTSHKAINIITVIEKCNSRYPGIKNLYAGLSESAHPNYEGTCIGYSDIDRENFRAKYSNKWKSIYGKKHIENMKACVDTFHHEYNDEWSNAFEELESWITDNDEQLEATKIAFNKSLNLTGANNAPPS